MNNTIKSALFYFVCISLFCISCNKPAEIITGQNPINIKVGDPYILQTSGGEFFLYGTSGIDGFETYSSFNLRDWKPEGQVYKGGTDLSWTKDCFWAPEVYFYKDKYYMFFSANSKNNPDNELEIFKIGVAVSDSPKGPFLDVSREPIFDPGYPIIDANVLFDEDGKLYLYYSRCCYKHPVESEISEWARTKKKFSEIEESWVYGVELKPDFTGVIGDPVLLLSPPATMDDKQAEWESRSVTSGEINRRWTEGSYIMKKDDTYYMMYSANYYVGENYAVGYATASHPLGPFTKAEDNPVLQKNTESGGIVTGTGHNSVLTLSDGEMYCVYHGRTAKTGEERVVFIDRMEITKGKKIKVYGPTTKN